MKSASFALLAVASGVWTLAVRPGPSGGSDVRVRIGDATDLGAHGRFDRVQRRRAGLPALPELQELARRSDQELRRGRTTSALSSAALLQAAAGRIDAALELLEEAALAGGPDAGLATDRAALYLIRSTTPGSRPGDAARALQLAGESLAVTPSEAARFNRAAALEALGLVYVARDAWREYLDRDRASPWRADAEVRLERLKRLPGPKDAPVIRRSLEHMALSSAAEVPSAVAAEPMHARLLVEEDLLGRWARATEARDASSADRALAAARVLAGAVRERQGDGLLAGSVSAIDNALPSEFRALVAGHLAYQDGLDRMGRDEWAAAEVAFAESHRRLVRARSPFAPCALLQSGVCAYYRPDYQAALAAFERVRVESGPHPLLRARALWLSGLVRFVTGRSFAALPEHREAREIFARSGETAHAAFVDSLLAADLQALGRRDQAWEPRSRALAGLGGIGEPRRIFSVLWECARVALDEGAPWAARDFLSEIAARGELSMEPMLQASTLARRARMAQRVGDWSAAETDAAEARRLLPRLPQPLAGRLEADLRVAEAEIVAAREPAAAVGAYTDALAFLDSAGNHLQSATLLRARARSHRVLGQGWEAEQDLERVLRAFDAGRLHLTDEAERIAFFELLAGAGDDLVALHLNAGRPWRAFEIAERTRARTLIGRVASRDGGADSPPDVATIQSRLPVGSALVEFALLDDRLVTWVVTPRAAGAIVRSIRAAELRDLVTRTHRAIGGGASPMRESLARLHDLLLQPIGSLLDGATTLLVVPDKVLHRVPFAALVDRRSDRYVAEDVALAFAPSAATVLRGRTRPPPAPRSVLVVVNDLVDVGRSDWPPLPAAREEGRRVAALYGESIVIEHAATTPRGVLGRLGGVDVIHMAAHTVGGREPRTTGLLLGPDAANASGLLTAEALASWTGSQPPRVAVLASCRTADGAASLEGPLSVARGFLALGTSAIVATLWDLPDAASARLVTGLHRRLAGGAAPAEALRLTQVDAIHAPGSEADPANWGSLVLIGGLDASEPENAPTRPSTTTGG